MGGQTRGGKGDGKNCECKPRRLSAAVPADDPQKPERTVDFLRFEQKAEEKRLKLRPQLNSLHGNNWTMDFLLFLYFIYFLLLFISL